MYATRKGETIIRLETKLGGVCWNHHVHLSTSSWALFSSKIFCIAIDGRLIKVNFSKFPSPSEFHSNLAQNGPHPFLRVDNQEIVKLA